MVLPDPDDPRWRADPTGPSGSPAPETQAPVELSAEERQRQADRLQRKHALQERLNTSGDESAPRVRGAWGTAEGSDDGPDERLSDEPPARRRPWLRRVAFATAAALLASGAALLIMTVSAGTNPLERRGTDGKAAADGAGSTPASVGWAGGDAVVQQADPIDLPTPAPNPAGDPKPLGTPPPIPTEAGNYRFLARQPTSDQPVAFDPCRTIRYLVNEADAPPGGDTVIVDALTDVSAATGLVFEPLGRTDTALSTVSETVKGADGRWSPVVIAWTNPTAEPRLADDVVGFAGGTRLKVQTPSATDGTVQQTDVYVSGVIALDGPQIAGILDYSPNGRAEAVAVVKHEAAHLVGLDHVDDPSEIMNPRGSALVTDFGPGDLRGLNQLGRGPCVPEA